MILYGYINNFIFCDYCDNCLRIDKQLHIPTELEKIIKEHAWGMDDKRKIACTQCLEKREEKE